MKFVQKSFCLLAITVGFSLPSLLSAAPVSLQNLSQYLTGLKSIRATFTQTNSDRSQSRGTLYLKRPGRVRFEYEPPNDALVMSGGGQVAIFDPRSNTGPERYPLSQTPLALILADNADLTTSNLVVAHRSKERETSVVLQDPDRPDQGRVELVFLADPLVLSKWIITDNTGSTTTVALKTMTLNAQIDNVKFNIVAETDKRNP